MSHNNTAYGESQAGRASSLKSGNQPKKLLKPGFCDVNRQMAHFPLARDIRKVADWKEDGEWLTSLLAGERKVRLSMRTNKPRYPTAFDINFLYYLMILAKVFGTKNLHLGTYKDALSLIEYSYSKANIDTLKDSLKFLSVMCISYKSDTQDEIKLPPPLERIEYPTDKFQDRGICVVISQAFLDYVTKKPTARLPLPLPKQTTTQNLVSLIQASSWPETITIDGETYDKARPPRPRSELARKAGLSGANRNKQLATAMENTIHYYARNGGGVRFVFRPGNAVQLVLVDPMDFKRARLPKPDAPKRKKPIKRIMVCQRRQHAGGQHPD